VTLVLGNIDGTSNSPSHSGDVKGKVVKVDCRTSQGNMTLNIIPEWAPLGAERFLQLVNDNFFSDLALFRCVSNFVRFALFLYCALVAFIPFAYVYIFANVANHNSWHDRF